MIVVTQYPPNYEEITNNFPTIIGKKGVIFTYGEAIFNPDGLPIDHDLQIHEATHSIQQDTIGPKAWWDKYFTDPQFRLSQELEAYQNQYRSFCDRIKDRNKRALYLFRLATDLGSAQYGNIISPTEAQKRIKNYKS